MADVTLKVRVVSPDQTVFEGEASGTARLASFRVTHRCSP